MHIDSGTSLLGGLAKLQNNFASVSVIYTLLLWPQQLMATIAEAALAQCYGDQDKHTTGDVMH
jgi:hypothetical protein